MITYGLVHKWLLLLHKNGKSALSMLKINPCRSRTNYLILHVTVIGARWLHSMHMACYMKVSTWLLYMKCMITVMGLVHSNEFVVAIWKYQKIHVTFYLVSTHIYAVYSQSLLIDTWLLYRTYLAWCIFCMLQVSTWWW